MFSAITLSLAILLTLTECAIHVELNNGGDATTVSRDGVTGSRTLTTNEVCTTPNRASSSVRSELEQGFTSFRASLNSSAMFNTKWSKVLADNAQKYTDQCDMGFSFPLWCAGSYTPSLGSYSHKKEIDISRLLEYMYNQREHYDSTKDRCKTDGDCSFFEYVARDTLTKFGCASTKCAVLKKRDGVELYNMTRTLCYFRHGNVLQHVPSDIKVPYSSKGAVCSKCDVLIQGVNICVNGLCGHGVCKSVKKCMYGRFNKETCACDCEKGFFGDNCRYPCRCVNMISDCKWVADLCKIGTNDVFLRENCSAACPRVCKVIKPKIGLKTCNPSV